MYVALCMLHKLHDCTLDRYEFLSVYSFRVYILCYMFPMLHRVFSVQLLLYVMAQSVHRVYTYEYLRVYNLCMFLSLANVHIRVYTFHLLYVPCVADVSYHLLQGDYSMCMYMHVYVSYMPGVICGMLHVSICIE